jgi:hypothetical protein
MLIELPTQSIKKQLPKTLLVLVCSEGRLNRSHRQTHSRLRGPKRSGSSDVMIEPPHLVVVDVELDEEHRPDTGKLCQEFCAGLSDP